MGWVALNVLGSAGLLALTPDARDLRPTPDDPRSLYDAVSDRSTGAMETNRAALAEHPFFDGMRPMQLERLSYYTRQGVFRAGTRIFNEGGRAKRFWLIRKGRVDLDTHLPGRPDATVESLGPGAVLGWSWLFPPYTWHFGAVARESTLTLELDATEVLRLCHSDPELGYELTTRFVALVVERLQATRLRLIDVYSASAPTS